MANENIYQSRFTGAEMDAFDVLTEELAAAIAALELAVAAKYSKPATGIPASDLDADVNAALAKANSAIQSLADYYTKSEIDAMVAAVNAQEYVDVTTLPAASADTLGKIYLVGPDGSGYYSYYFTSYDGSAYSWVGPLGTTEISLAGYASKAELNQLDQKVGAGIGERNVLSYSQVSGKYVNYTDGVLTTSGVNTALTDVDVSGLQGKTLHYSRVNIPSSAGFHGMAFYNGNGQYISGVAGILNASQWSISPDTVVVPNNAVKAAFTCPTDFLGSFQLYVDVSITDKVKSIDQYAGGALGDVSLIHNPDWVASFYVRGDNGQILSSGVNSYLRRVDVSEYVGKRLYFSLPAIPAAEGFHGMAFYTEGGTFISGKIGQLNAPAWGLVLSDMVVPANAKYANFTCPTDLRDSFVLAWRPSLNEDIKLLNKRCQENTDRLDVLQPGDPSWLNDGFVNAHTIAIEASDLYRYSYPYPMKAGTVVRVNSAGGNISLVTKSNKDGELLATLVRTPYDASADTNIMYEYVIPEDGYYILCYKYAITGSYVQFVNAPDYAITDKEYIYVDKPKFARLDLYGVMPYDQSETRLPTRMSAMFSVGGKILFRCLADASIQGHGSTAYAKKGYTLDLLNVNEDGLLVKFGDMIAADSFHLKGYATDMTHSRGVSGAKVWRSMLEVLEFPRNLVTNKALNLSVSQKKDAIFWSDAKFSEDGFPVEVYLCGVFWGLYTVKLKKSRTNYALDNSNKGNIFIDAASADNTAYLSQTFDAGDWELKSPKIAGYVDNGEITDADVLASIGRLWNFTQNLSTMYAQHADYIVLDHWLLWFIICELVGHRDTSGNNYELLTWDNTHWSILPYDLDLTLGLNAWNGYTIETSLTGWTVGTQPGSGDTAFWQTFRTVYASELSAMYAKLRQRGIIEIGKLSNIYKEQVASIPRDVYAADLSKWGSIWDSGDNMPTIQQTLAVLESRIEFLDSQWL